MVGQAGELRARLREEYPEAFGGLFFEYAPMPVITVNWNLGDADEPPGWLLESPNVSVSMVDFSEGDLAA